ncbi:glucosamine-6-phosphate deaminase [Melghirimyces profundicolus]|uniref:Glucosamine-6-phosphate deaminase n=1 Tax=Melghirimyces profundicolus TaxID=1242148 RepID=A0A2T6C8A1_9BACL|nr:glucosamine-6-phosphate deaminase [Melghirimyces profundicolus]PTX64529.1 glucosamine-6-phosphate deaminase [Melghirimyces profundicolus]
MKLVCTKNDDEMAREGARRVAEIIRSRSMAVLGLATGGTPEGMYRELVRLHRRGELDFSGVSTFNLDEYLELSPSDEPSYHAYMDRHLFVNISGKNIHLMRGDTSDPAGRTRVVKLSESTRRANARYFRDQDDIPRRALSMGLGTILEFSREILLLASGVKKAEAVRRMLRGPVTASCPASLLRQHSRVTVILDPEAARLV